MNAVINPIYWVIHDPLDTEDAQVLWQIHMGIQPFYRNRLSVAYLVALECVKADLVKEELSLTEKGQDALEYYKPTLRLPKKLA